ncbi:MAG: AraC family transcriptional regulator [Eubacteriales bacterium]|nr:AraC family transcriptional regulator [Eubacteriales bacterium]
MNQIVLNNVSLPVVSSCDYLAAQEPFLHADRIVDFHVMIYVTDGCIPVTEDGTDYEIHAGELFFLKNKLRHYGKKDVGRGTRWHYVHFYLAEPSVIEAARPVALGIAGQNPELSSPAGGWAEFSALQTLVLPKKISGLSGSRLEQKIAGFTEYFRSDAPLDVWSRNQKFFELLTEIGIYEEAEKKPLSLSDRIADYLTENYRRPFSSQELEQEFFLSYKRMAAVFKKEKGMSMQRFHTNVRMENACKLLRSTLLPVGEISRETGYADMLYFSRSFRSVVGMSPTEYRKLPRIY